MNKKETMLEAFLRQSKLTYEPEKHKFETSYHFDEKGKLIKKETTTDIEDADKSHQRSIVGDLMMKDARDRLAKSQAEFDKWKSKHSQLNPEDLKTGIDVHKNFRNYDHSLEINRWKGEGGADSIEMGDMGSNDV
jgi:tRNA A22 N-methylase